MSRDDNADEDVVEIDFGKLGRRIRGFFGNKDSGKKEEAAGTGGADTGASGGNAAGAAGVDAGPKKDGNAPKAKGGPAANEKKGESTSEANEGNRPEAAQPIADGDDEYFEIDISRLLGRRKGAEKGQQPQAPEPAKAENPEGAASAGEGKQEDAGASDKKGEDTANSEKHAEEGPDAKEAMPEPAEGTADGSAEQIEIDFGKLFGKRKKTRPATEIKEHWQEGGPAKQGSEDTVEIDLGKIGSSIASFFGGKKDRKSLKKEKKEEEEGEEYLKEVELDIDSIGKKVIQHRKLAVFFLLAAVVSFSLYIRLLSASSPLSPDYDTYLHYRYARTIIESKFQIPKWDLLSYYPTGRPFMDAPGYPMMEAYFYLFLARIWPAVSLMNSGMVLTALFGGLAVIPAYVIGREASGAKGGILAAFFVGSLPAILIRTVGSYADTDASVTFFSLSIVALYIKSIESIRDKPTAKTWAYTLLAALAGSVFNYTWGGANHIFFIIFGFQFFLLLFYFAFTSGNILTRVKVSLTKSRYVILFTLIFFTAVYFGFYTLQHGSIASGPKGIITGYTDAFNIIGNFNSVSEMKSESGGISNGTYGKNVFVSVAEMQAPGLEAYTSQMGGLIFLALTFFILGGALIIIRYGPKAYHERMPYILSIILLAASITIKSALSEHPLHEFLYQFLLSFSALFFIVGLFNRSKTLVTAAHAFFENDTQARIMLLVLLWSASLFLISTLAIRFIMVLAAPIAVASGVLLDRILRLVELSQPKIGPLLLLLIVAWGVASLGIPAYDIGKGARGSMDPNWHDMLTWIKENSAPDATVITWWDPGHWVTAIAQRRSGADGAHSGLGPYPISVRIEDFGYSFATNNETGAVERLSKYRGDSSEMYYISSNDLIGKFVWLSYFGMGTKQQYLIAGESGAYQQDGGKIHVYQLSQNVAIVVKETGGEVEPWLYVNNNKIRIREAAFFDSNGNLQRARYKEGEDAMVWLQADMRAAVYLPGTMKDNILTRTYFFNGDGLDKFKLIYLNPVTKLYKVKF